MRGTNNRGARRRAWRLILAACWAAFCLAALSWELELRREGRPELTANERFWLNLYDVRAPVFVREPDGRRRLSAGLVELDNAPRSFAERPPAGVPRVLCVGGSTTAGWPFHPKGGYPEWLRLMLADALGRPVEVVNAGVHAYGVHEDLRILGGLREIPWDLVIAYEGHNLEATADDCRPTGLRWRLHADLWLTRHSHAYRRFKELLGARGPEIRHGQWDAPERRTGAYRECLARRLESGLEELGALARARGWTVLLIAPVRGGRLWDGGEILASLERGARRNQFRFLDAEAAAREALPDMPELTVGDNIHPVLKGQWAIAKAVIAELARDGWPAPGSFKTARLKDFKTYLAGLRIDDDFMAAAHARLGLAFAEMRNPHAESEFAAAERLKPGVVSSAVGPTSSTAVLVSVLRFFESKGDAAAADGIRQVLWDRREPAPPP